MNNINLFKIDKEELRNYFFELAIELFDVGTPSFYRVKSTNSHLILKEIEAYLFLDEDELFLKGGDLTDLIHEFIDNYSKDSSWIDKPNQRIMSSFIKFLNDRIRGKNNKTSEDTDKRSYHDFIVELKIRIIPTLVWFDSYYKSQLIRQIRQCLDMDIPQSKTFTRLKKLTCVFSAEILAMGFSRYYLHERFMGLKLNSITLDDFFDDLNKNSRKFNVYHQIQIAFKASSNQTSYIRTIMSGLKSTDGNNLFLLKNVKQIQTFPFQQSDIDVPLRKPWIADTVKILINPTVRVNTVFLKLEDEVLASDPNSAGTISANKIEPLLDILGYEFNKAEIRYVPSSCVVSTEDDTGKKFLYIVPTTDFVNSYKRPFSLKGLQKWIDAYKNIRDIDNKGSKETIDKVSRLFAFHRHYTEAETLEHKFLNLWIALEYVFSLQNGEKSSFKNFLNYYPKIYSVQYVFKILKDLMNAQINRSNQHTQEKVKKLIEKYRDSQDGDSIWDFGVLFSMIRKTPDFEHFSGELKTKEIADKIKAHKTKYGNAWDELISLLKDDTLTGNKLFRLREITFGDLKKTLEKQHKYKIWELKRLYRLRNGLVHRGTAEQLNIDLGMHINILEDIYVDILETVLEKFSKNAFHSSLEAFFLSFEKTYESIVQDPELNTWCLPSDIINLIDNKKLLF